MQGDARLGWELDREQSQRGAGGPEGTIFLLLFLCMNRDSIIESLFIQQISVGGELAKRELGCDIFYSGFAGNRVASKN